MGRRIYDIPTLYLISTATKQRVNIVFQKGISVGIDIVPAINIVLSVSAIRSTQSLDNKPSSSHENIRKDHIEWRTHFYRMFYFFFFFFYFFPRYLYSLMIDILFPWRIIHRRRKSRTERRHVVSILSFSASLRRFACDDTGSLGVSRRYRRWADLGICGQKTVSNRWLSSAFTIITNRVLLIAHVNLFWISIHS